MLAAVRDQLIANDFLSPERREVVGESERQLLGQLFRRGRCTQAMLTERLPISQQSISRMAKSLEDRGLIRRGLGKPTGQRGQPSAIMELNSSFAATIGVSILADGISVTLTDFSGSTLAQANPELASLSRESILSATNAAASTLIDCAGIAQSRVFGIGIATSGFRVGKKATFNTPPTLEELALVDLETLFSREFSLPAWADNDGNTATVAENMTGVGRRLDNFAYFYIATGVGGGVVSDGKLMNGARGNAGEFVGILPPDSYTFPNLELLRARVNEAGGDFASVNELVNAYDDKLPGIDSWIEEVVPSLSLMASATSAILDTEAIVLGGLLPRQLAKRLAPRIEFYDIHRRETPREHARVIPAECKGDATALGASLLPLSDKYFQF